MTISRRRPPARLDRAAADSPARSSPSPSRTRPGRPACRGAADVGPGSAPRHPAARRQRRQRRVPFSRRCSCDALGWGDALVDGAALPAVTDRGRRRTRRGAAPRLRLPCRARRRADRRRDRRRRRAGRRRPGTTTRTRPRDCGRRPTEDEVPWRLLGMWVPWGTHPLRRTVQAAGQPARSSGSPRCSVPATSRSASVSDGRWWALVWAPRGKPVGAAVWDASLWSEEPETLAAFVALLERRRFLGVAGRDRLPGAARPQRQRPGRGHRRPRRAGPGRGGDAGPRARRARPQRRAATLLAGVSRRRGLRRRRHRDDARGLPAVRRGTPPAAQRRRPLRHAPTPSAASSSSSSSARPSTASRPSSTAPAPGTGCSRSPARCTAASPTRTCASRLRRRPVRPRPVTPGSKGTRRRPAPRRRPHRPAHARSGPVRPAHGERRRLTFRALDVEQIGYVYEGLLELEVRTATEPVLMPAPQGADGLDLIPASSRRRGRHRRPARLGRQHYQGKKKATAGHPQARHAPARRADVAPSAPIALDRGLGRRCAAARRARAAAAAATNATGPAGHPPGGRYVAASTRRAATGAHYTPRSLAEEVVQHALEPLDLPARAARDPRTRRHGGCGPPTEILALRVADIAMGSGAFLVAACRFLADRLVEAWDAEGDVEASRALAHRTAGAADAEVDGVLLARPATRRRALPLRRRHQPPRRRDGQALALAGHHGPRTAVRLPRRPPRLRRLPARHHLAWSSSRPCTSTPSPAASCAASTLDFGAGWRQMLARAADTRRRITATPGRHRPRRRAQGAAPRARPTRLTAPLHASPTR